MKIEIFSILSIASLTVFFSACGGAVNVTSNNSPLNAANKSNTAVVVNSAQTPAHTATPIANVSNAAANNSNAANKTTKSETSKSSADAQQIQGELQIGKSESLILYVGEETGDYAAYCFANNSEAGRSILAGCKDKQVCSVTGIVAEGECKVPGLEATLSASGKITKVEAVKTVRRRN